MLRKLKLK